MGLRAVIFDLDGTVVENVYNWPAIREELETGDASVLGYLDSLEGPDRSRKWAILERHEFEQTAGSVLRQGVGELLAFLKDAGVRSALVTNNSRANTDFILAKFDLVFDLVLTRESGLWKPSGAPLLRVMDRFAVSREECCVVGDSRFDFLAAVDAGIARIFILSAEAGSFAGFPVEVYESIEPLRRRLEELV